MQWIPAFAGMTGSVVIPAKAGIHSPRRAARGH